MSEEARTYTFCTVAASAGEMVAIPSRSGPAGLEIDLSRMFYGQAQEHDQANLRQLFSSLQLWTARRRFDVVALRGAASGGKQRTRSLTFALETIAQLSFECGVIVLPGATVSAWAKRAEYNPVIAQNIKRGVPVRLLERTIETAGFAHQRLTVRRETRGR